MSDCDHAWGVNDIGPLGEIYRKCTKCPAIKPPEETGCDHTGQNPATTYQNGELYEICTRCHHMTPKEPALNDTTCVKCGTEGPHTMTLADNQECIDLASLVYNRRGKLLGAGRKPLVLPAFEDRVDCF